MQKTVCWYLVPVPRNPWQKLNRLKKTDLSSLITVCTDNNETPGPGSRIQIGAYYIPHITPRDALTNFILTTLNCFRRYSSSSRSLKYAEYKTRKICLGLSSQSYPNRMWSQFDQCHQGNAQCFLSRPCHHAVLLETLFTNRSSTNGKLLARASPSGMRHVLQEMTVKLLSLLAIGFLFSS